MQTMNARSHARGRLASWPLVLAGLTAMALAPCALAQQIYGWTDANGEVTYSNLPPPKGAKVTDVIPDTPVSPRVAQEAARRSEISALNDRIRLLELEQARSKREVVDYSPPPPQALATPCAPDGAGDCNPQWGPYYTTGFLYGTGVRRHRDDHDGHGGSHPAHAPLRITPPPPAQATPIAASPNKSSLQQR